MFPVIGVAAIVGLVTSAGALIWYSQLSPEEKKRYDKLAADYAWDLFEKKVADLTHVEKKQVHDYVTRHFN